MRLLGCANIVPQVLRAVNLLVLWRWLRRRAGWLILRQGPTMAVDGEAYLLVHYRSAMAVLVRLMTIAHGAVPVSINLPIGSEKVLVPRHMIYGRAGPRPQELSHRSASLWTLLVIVFSVHCRTISSCASA